MSQLTNNLQTTDPEIAKLISEELHRQQNNIELIASENFASFAVLTAQGSILTNKYAEGYPGKRYYGGCINVDGIEQLAIDRLKQLYQAKYANVQPHSGSSANMAAYRALLTTGDTVLGMALDQGGHLTHGHPLSFSGIDYNFVPYYLDKETETIDYDKIKEIGKQVKPKLIVAGASAYSRIIDFSKLKDIAQELGCYLMVDMAHIAGLVAAGLHPNPVLYADIVTSTTHKTLRGPRGGFILTNDEEIAKRIDKGVFPGIQGGPLMHIIAAKAVAFKEALDPSFKEYQLQVVKNAKALADALSTLGYKIVSKTTENHLLIVNVKESVGLTGKVAEKILDKILITCNKNTVPYDTEKPFITSGIRLGTPSVTTRGFKEKEMVKIAEFIDRAFKNYQDEEQLAKIKTEVLKLTSEFPIY